MRALICWSRWDCGWCSGCGEGSAGVAVVAGCFVAGRLMGLLRLLSLWALMSLLSLLVLLVLLALRAGRCFACDRVGRGSALRLAVRLDPAWTAGSSGFRSFDWHSALAI